MPSGGVSGYSAINARVRVMYSTLISSAEMMSLSESPDYPSLVSQLKHTAWGPYLEKISDKDLNPRRAVFQIKGRLTDAYESVIRMAPEHTRSLILQLFRYYEVDNLKAVLRGIVTGADWDKVRYVLFPQDSLGGFPAQAMVESGNVVNAVDLMRSTPYYDTLSFAVKRYSTEQNLFPMEVALDLAYWRALWKDVGSLPKADQAEAKKILGAMLDMNNLMWAIRYRVYHHLSEEELINYTLSVGYHVRDADIRLIAAGADIAHLVKRLYPDLTEMDEILREPWDRLPELEMQLKRRILRQCQSAFVGDPFHIGVLVGYLVLNDFEIQDLTVLIEAKSTKKPASMFKPFILNSFVTN